MVPLIKGILSVSLYLACVKFSTIATRSTTTQTTPIKRCILCLLECNVSNYILLFFLFNFTSYFLIQKYYITIWTLFPYIFIDKLSIIINRMVIKYMHNDNYYFDIIRYNIKKQRESAGLTQQQLADKVGITMNYLAKIESKKMQRGISIVILGRIADALDIDIKELFTPINK